ncbi:MAG TPA: nitroreductase/quinone reductase family protein [Trebonia sp.]|nr:nitroreductase/quinone reductase family protein [Trebonia sp.]
MNAETRYLKPAKASNIFNDSVGWLTRRGISVYGTRMLYVRGRKSGELRSQPVNPLPYEGQRYLVAPRGTTQWVRNIRAADGQAELRLGRKVEPIRVIELADDDKPALLRAYLKKWAFETGVFFDGLTAKSSDEELRAAAPGYPIFRIETR